MNNQIYKAAYFFVITAAVFWMLFDQAVNYQSRSVIGQVQMMLSQQDKNIGQQINVVAAQYKMMQRDVDELKGKAANEAANKKS